MSKPSKKDTMNKAFKQPNAAFGSLLKSVRKSAKMSASNYAAAAGIHVNSQGNYENAKREISIDYLIHFCSTVGVSFWQMLYHRVEFSKAPEAHKRIIMGELEPFLSFLQTNSPNPSAEKQTEQVKSNHQKMVNKEVVKACHQAMHKLIRNTHIKVFTQQSGSMSPTINYDDILLVDSSKTTLTNGDIYVFEFQKSICAKRVQLLPKEGVILTSDNASFHPITLNKAQTQELKVLGKLTRSISSYR